MRGHFFLYCLIAAACGDNLRGNQPPTILSGLTVTTAEDTPVTHTIVATDPDGDTLSFSIIPPLHGTVTANAGVLTYTPAPNYSGTDQILVTVSDGFEEITGTVEVTVTAVNDAPVGVAESFATAEDTPLTVARSALVANDTDVDSPTLTLTQVANPVHGTVAISGDNVVFTPEANFEGDGSFEYTVSDGALTAVVTVTVEIGGANDAPVAVDDTAMTAEDTPIDLTSAMLTANDTDPEGQTLMVTAVGNPTNGTVSLAGGTATFTPSANFNGTATFEYTVSDGSLTDVGLVTITVTPVNDAPVAVDDSATTPQNTAVDIPHTTLLANDSDVDTGATLTITAVQNATNGTATLNASTITFTPAMGFTGIAMFEYVVSDGTLTDVGLVMVDVTGCTPVDDMIDCTMDVCQNGNSEHIPLDAACELDGAACSVPTCSAITGCSEAPNNTICSDGATCTTDTCSPGAAGANGAGCVITPEPVVCDDSLTCTTDTCAPGTGGADPTTGCVNTSTCDDSIACTVDTCGGGGCTNTPNDTLCPMGDICVADSGCRTPLASLLITELGILGGSSSEMIEVFNTGTAGALDGATISNIAGQTVTIRPASDPTGALNQTLTLAAGAFAWGVPNPADPSNIPAGATFVYGDPGTTFSFADTAELIAITAQNGMVVDDVDLASIVSDPNVAIGAAAFPAFAGHTTQLNASAIVASAPEMANDAGGDWCTTFRAASTAGAANQSCTVAVINEALIDSTGADDGNTFVEIAGPGGGQIGGAQIEDIEGRGASAGTRNATPAATIPAGRRIPADGLLIVADELGTTGTTNVAGVTAADVIVSDMDLENSGGDSIQLVSSTNALLDAVGHDPAGTALDTNMAVNGHAMFETATAITPATASSMARDVDSADTGHNRNDFHNDPSPTPGAPNGPVTLTITSISPNNGLASTTTTGVRITGTDLGSGATITVGGQAATSCSFAAVPTSVTCTFPMAMGGMPGRVDVVYTNTAAAGGAVATATNGWTYTGVLNETDVAEEADFCNLQFPSLFTVQAGQSSPTIFGRIFEAGATEAPGAPPGIIAEVGFGPAASSPTTSGAWRFFSTSFNVQVGNDDEFMGTFTAPTTTGTFLYTYRFSSDTGIDWTYCDANGAGSNAGLTFEPATQLGTMTVTP